MSDCGCDSHDIKLIPYHDALGRLVDAAVPLADMEEVVTAAALGRVLAEPVFSGMDVPPADNSAMDGYALRSNDILGDGDITLPVSQRIPAGTYGQPLAAGTAARIFTGAPVPPGADAVVMQEVCTASDDIVAIPGPVAAGQNIRRAGEDISSGQELLAAGRRIRPQEMGLIASVGHATVSVVRRLRVAIFFTGDELVEPGGSLKPGQIYDSNRFTLLGLLAEMGCDVVDLGVVGDTLASTRQAIRSAADQADLVITSGGVSVGEEDHVRIALEEEGDLNMWRIAIKPGKPLAYGTAHGAPFIGLPGNPVSVFATFCLFVSPFIKRMQGMTSVVSRAVPVRAGFDWPKPGTRREFLRARLEQDAAGLPQAVIYPHQGSGVLTSTSWAEGFVEVPEGTTVTAGQTVDYLPMSQML